MAKSTSPLQPALELVHVTDLHVKVAQANAAHPLAAKRRLFARKLRDIIERRNLFGWDEGTQGHYTYAPESFRRFLHAWVARDADWDKVPRWLVDTGDRTAFGDVASITAGAAYLQLWAQALRGASVRTLFGNHDAWPGTLPLLRPGGIKAQRRIVEAVSGWNPKLWRSSRLSVPIPGRAGHHIDLYAIDSVCWGVSRNTRAVGHLKKAALRSLQSMLGVAKLHERQGVRVLALHHPLAFPWTTKEARKFLVFKMMRLLKDHAHARRLRNDGNDPEGIGPWIHLFLSGHTHLRHPANGLPPDVTDVHQGLLDRLQLQLVGGPLMLNRSRAAARQPSSSAPAVERAHDEFSPSTVDTRTCQAQILRFLVSPAHPRSLYLIRIPVVSVDGGATYEDGTPDGLLLHY